ncbi:anaerobic C4-dicarboxylate transporter family protein, partial [Escherichia coli]|nr:anaerobic C4-dicarboxylate transporter family protein [Escherichia coli]
SAAVVAFAAMLHPFGVDYLTLLAICIPTTFIACMIGAFVANFMGCELKDDAEYQERLEKGLIKLNTEAKREILPTAKKATFIFLG